MNVGKLTSRKLQSAVAGVGLVALLAAASFAHGAGSPFASLSGAWTGRGAVTLASGTKENIRCKANYNVDGGGVNLKLSLRCSSDNFKFELESNVAHSNGQVSGHWSEMTHRVGGTVTGKVAGDRIQVRVDGAFAAMLEISTRADQQSVSIQSPGSPMSAVAISLSRAGKQTAMK
jgi:hypothetical protein